MTESKTVVLVAGGIGITPMHAHLAELFAQSQAVHAEGKAGGTGAKAGRGRVGQLQHVHLIWTARDDRLLALYVKMITLHHCVTGATSSGS